MPRTLAHHRPTLVLHIAPLLAALSLAVSSAAGEELPPLPSGARLVLDEDWSTGRIDRERWYLFRKKWGQGNHGVVPENVTLGEDQVAGERRQVLVCTAHGDQYDGEVVGWQGNKSRVGGVIVSHDYFASGRFEVVLKIGATEPHPGGPQDPRRPIGSVPAVWTYGYRWVQGDPDRLQQFQPDHPLYNPHIPAYGGAANEYWSELDFPEFGKAGDFRRAMYNTFLQNRHDNQFFDASAAIDGNYHRFTTDWRTRLKPMPDITDSQVVEAEGYYWIQDKSIPLADYLGNPLKRLGPDKYALYQGHVARHWIDGQFVGQNTGWVPAMAAQLNLGIWLPSWAGPAPWETATLKIASVRVWQFDDEGDVRGILRGRNPDNFAPSGEPLD